MPEALGIDGKKCLVLGLVSGGNKERPLNGWVMSLLADAFGIVRWIQTELDSVDRQICKIVVVRDTECTIRGRL